MEITATTRTADRTGVEMEALTAVAAAGLALVDMIKAVDPAATIDSVRVLRKEGGKTGLWERGRRDGVAMRARVIVASNRAWAGVYADSSGPILVAGLRQLGFDVGRAGRRARRRSGRTGAAGGGRRRRRRGHHERRYGHHAHGPDAGRDPGGARLRDPGHRRGHPGRLARPGAHRDAVPRPGRRGRAHADRQPARDRPAARGTGWRCSARSCTREHAVAISSAGGDHG